MLLRPRVWPLAADVRAECARCLLVLRCRSQALLPSRPWSASSAWSVCFGCSGAQATNLLVSG
jgi:hypothetical protein